MEGVAATHCLDACAVMAYVRQEPGAEVLKALIERPPTVLAMHVCHLGEVYAERAKTEIDVGLIRLRRLPYVLLGERPGGLATAKVLIDTVAGETVETFDGGREPGRIDAQFGGKLWQRIRARHPMRNLAAARRVDKREAVDVLPIEEQIAGQDAVPVLLDVVLA